MVAKVLYPLFVGITNFLKGKPGQPLIQDRYDPVDLGPLEIGLEAENDRLH